MEAHQTESALEKTRWGIGAKILAAGVVAVAVWLGTQELREASRINELAALPACELAAEYAAWRLAFEDQHPAEEPSGEAAAEFERENETFEQAGRQARETADSPVLEALENITALDPEPWIRERGDLTPFVDIVLTECRDEMEALIRGDGS